MILFNSKHPTTLVRISFTKRIRSAGSRQTPHPVYAYKDRLSGTTALYSETSCMHSLKKHFTPLNQVARLAKKKKKKLRVVGPVDIVQKQDIGIVLS